MAKLQKKQRKSLAHEHLEVVRDQYEDLPYPPRNPEDDNKRLVTTYGDSLQVVSHRGFEGKLKFDKVRVLTAGGGTGDATIYYAEQLRHYPDAEVVYVDFSEHSMSIAKRRAEIRGLTNIKFVHGSLLECKNLGIGQFDIINCVGVLHHLDDPDAGLRALKEVLKPEGVMNIMLYGYYGRLEVYMIQDTLKLLSKNAKTNQERVELAKALLPALPPTSLMVQNKNKWMYELKSGDGAIFDLLCHPQDRAYTVPQIKEFLEQAKLQLVTFYGKAATRTKYDVLHQYAKNPAILKHIEKLDNWEQLALAELASMPTKHSFMCTKKDVVKKEIKLIASSVVCFSSATVSGRNVKDIQAQMQDDLAPLVIKFGAGGENIRLGQFNRKSPETKFLLEIDDRRSVAEIYEDMKEKNEDIAKMSLEEFIKMAERIYVPLESLDILCAIEKGTGLVRRWNSEKHELVDELEL